MHKNVIQEQKSTQKIAHFRIIYTVLLDYNNWYINVYCFNVAADNSALILISK